jgi:hypothetical protein
MNRDENNSRIGIPKSGQKPAMGAICGGQCSHCALQAQAGLAGPKGWRLVLPAAGAFLAPLFLATVAAAVVDDDGAAQIIAAFGGLAIGLALAIAVGRLTRRTAKEIS